MCAKANKRVRLKEIADIVGISKGAVSMALNNSPKISDLTKAKVSKIAQKLGYRKSAILSSVMSSIKSEKTLDFLETIVLINANRAEDAPKRFPIFLKYINGIKEEAKDLGYGVYSLWLHDPKLSADRMREILESRGIRGGVIIGHADDNILPDTFSEIWKNFKFVSAGLRTFKPTLDFISADKFLIAQYATMKIIKSGYSRPAFVIDEHIDELVEGRFIGGFLRAQLKLPLKSRIPPFINIAQAKLKPKILFDWINKYRPDAVFSVSSLTSQWLGQKEISGNFPKGTNLILLERSLGSDDWVAIDKNYELVGRLAVRKLFDILNSPVKMRDINAATATIVQPHWNNSIDLKKL